MKKYPVELSLRSLLENFIERSSIVLQWRSTRATPTIIFEKWKKKKMKKKKKRKSLKTTKTMILPSFVIACMYSSFNGSVHAQPAFVHARTGTPRFHARARARRSCLHLVRISLPKRKYKCRLSRSTLNYKQIIHTICIYIIYNLQHI